MAVGICFAVNTRKHVRQKARGRNGRAVLQLHRHILIHQLHQEPAGSLETV